MCLFTTVIWFQSIGYCILSLFMVISAILCSWNWTQRKKVSELLVKCKLPVYNKYKNSRKQITGLFTLVDVFPKASFMKKSTVHWDNQYLIRTLWSQKPLFNVCNVNVALTNLFSVLLYTYGYTFTQYTVFMHYETGIMYTGQYLPLFYFWSFCLGF